MTRIVGIVAGALMMAAMMRGAAPSIDKTKLEAYLRYAEGYLDNVHFTIEDPVASSVPNFYRVAVHLSTENGAKLDRVYLMTQDGREIVNGTVWDLSQSPFAEKLAEMPQSGYAFGPADAKVKLVIFSDFECPYCREFAKTVRENIPKKYPKDVRVVFEDFPLEPIHPWARAAAEASHCVGDQNADAFWAYHDWIFEHATEIKADTLKAKILAWAGAEKLDVPKLESCMDTHAEAGVVSQSEKRGRELMVQQTPTAFVNGREVPAALPWKDLDSVIQIELRRASGTATPMAMR
jgi:protein-disulfide isomerase